MIAVEILRVEQSVVIFALVQVPRHIVHEVADPTRRDKYSEFAARSYVEDNKRVKWCPAPGCEFAVEALGDVSAEPLDVFCRCGSPFCFTCLEEAHRPVQCDTVRAMLQT